MGGGKENENRLEEIVQEDRNRRERKSDVEMDAV